MPCGKQSGSEWDPKTRNLRPHIISKHNAQERLTHLDVNNEHRKHSPAKNVWNASEISSEESQKESSQLEALAQKILKTPVSLEGILARRSKFPIWDVL